MALIDADDVTWECAVIQQHNGKNFANVVAVHDDDPTRSPTEVGGIVQDAWTASGSFSDAQV